MLFIGAAFVAPAQDLGVYEPSSNPLRTLYHKITRYVANQEKLPWVLAVRRQMTKAVPLRFSSIQWNLLPPQPQPPLTGPHATDLSNRLVTWQTALRHHLVLRNFTVKILHPQELSRFSPRQTEVLERFLQNGITAGTADARYTPVKVEEFKRALVRLTFQTPHEKPFYLTANCYTHELFVSLRPNVLGIKLEPLFRR